MENSDLFHSESTAWSPSRISDAPPNETDHKLPASVSRPSRLLLPRRFPLASFSQTGAYPSRPCQFTGRAGVGNDKLESNTLHFLVSTHCVRTVRTFGPLTKASIDESSAGCDAPLTSDLGHRKRQPSSPIASGPFGYTGHEHAWCGRLASLHHGKGCALRVLALFGSIDWPAGHDAGGFQEFGSLIVYRVLCCLRTILPERD